jgi:DNA-binding XRE family transcriptional regulator
MKKKNIKWARPFVKSLLKDPEVRILYEEEKAKTKIALAMKAVRKDAGLTQSELAEKVGTTQSVIARLESGKDERVPSLPFLARIASACNVALEFGFRFKNSRTRELRI